MKVSTLPLYLLGSRGAILRIASSPWSVLVGLIFVISAGLAREYDGEDLIHEPWHALRPLGASLVSGTTLFLVVHLASLMRRGKGEGEPPSLFRAWRVFMGLFWMTAPMAWLYAVPYERFMNPVDAIAVNLWTLGIVSFWRVSLMTRVIRVIYGIGAVPAFFLVMLFADAVVFAVMSLVPMPVIDVMGGIRHSDREALLASVTFMVMVLSLLTAPLWILGALFSACLLKPRWATLKAPKPDEKPGGLMIFAAASVAAFIPLLMIAQPEQINKREAEELLTSGEVARAFALMSELSPDAYPPQWNPPPRAGYRESSPGPHEIREALQLEMPSEWVALLYIRKMDEGLRRQLSPPYRSSLSWSELVPILEEGWHEQVGPEWIETARFLLDHRPEQSELDHEHLQRIIELLEQTDEALSD